MNALSVNGGSAVDFGYEADGLLVSAGDMALTRGAQNGRLTGSTLNTVNDRWNYTGFGAVQSHVSAAGASALDAMSFKPGGGGDEAVPDAVVAGIPIRSVLKGPCPLNDRSIG